VLAARQWVSKDRLQHSLVYRGFHVDSWFEVICVRCMIRSGTAGLSTNLRILCLLPVSFGSGMRISEEPATSPSRSPVPLRFPRREPKPSKSGPSRESRSKAGPAVTGRHRAAPDAAHPRGPPSRPSPGET
jgi:hypothetical protein